VTSNDDALFSAEEQNYDDDALFSAEEQNNDDALFSAAEHDARFSAEEAA